jgi:hypothetical protein
MAWTVVDEGVKARIDLPYDPKLNGNHERLSRLRAPSRPRVDAISESTSELVLDSATAPKIISLSQAELNMAKKDSLRPYYHDLTSFSNSLLVNVADGGIKADLTRAFEDSKLPVDLTSRYVYSNSKSRMAVADPLFSTLAGYYQLYKQTVSPLQVAVPTGYSPLRGTVPNLAPLNGTLIAPVVTRVSVVFSLVSRVGHGHWQTSIPSQTGDSQRRNMIYLIYTPVVTVYNPYSVPIQFRDLKVSFRNLPVAFKFFRNGQAQTFNPTLLSTFHILSEGGNDWEDKFSCTVSNNAGQSSGALVTLYPGECRVFGESHPPTARWGDMTNYVWDANQGSRDDQTKTKNVFSGAGWDYRSGYLVDWLRPAVGGRTADNGNLGVFGVRPTDSVNVEVSPMMPSASNGKFTVDFQAKVNGRDLPLGAFEYSYGNQKKLTDILQNGNHTTIGKIKFPFRRERDFTVGELTLSNPDNISIQQWGSVPKQFAIFTMSSRTANDSLYPGKPGKTSSFVHHVLQMDANRNHPALLPMEISLLPITGAGANTVGSIDADDADRMFYFSGTNRGNGAIHYVSQHLPASPLLNLADLRHANLASSGHLPLVQHTVGESQAPPIVPSNAARAASNFGYEVLDHAWLANQTLWDGFFFSGVRSQSDVDLLLDQKTLSLNPRISAVGLPGVSQKDASAKAVSASSWADIGSMLVLKGGFNVNSTSKDAWKAMLMSLKGLDVPVLGPIQIKDPSVPPANYKEVILPTSDAPFPRISRPIGEKVTAANSNDNQRRWAGFRELTEGEIERLAENIVIEIRERGPFLSMAEFVNRRLSSAGDDMAARGTLEEAIRKSEINNIQMGPVNRVINEQEAASYGFANPKAATGSTEEGASAILSQGDLLSAIGASVTVRSDTFVVRAYGAARDGNRIIARAWCEAVVQRMPVYVDPSQAPEMVQAASLDRGRTVADLNAVNRKFGRRFELLSFRWMTENEV